MLRNRAQLKHPTTATSSPCPWSVGSITATPAKQPPESPSTRLHCPPRRTAAGRSIRASARPPFGRVCHSPSNPSYFYLMRIVVGWNFQIRFGLRYPQDGPGALIDKFLHVGKIHPIRTPTELRSH